MVHQGMFDICLERKILQYSLWLSVNLGRPVTGAVSQRPSIWFRFYPSSEYILSLFTSYHSVNEDISQLQAPTPLLNMFEQIRIQQNIIF